MTGAQHVRASGGPATTEPVPADLVTRIAATPGVRVASGDVSVDGARVVGPDGKVIASTGPPRLGIAWHGDDGLIELRSGRGPRQPDEVAINASLAQESGVSVGDQVGVLTRQPKRTFTVVGVFGYRGARDSLAGETRVAFTEPVAQELMLGRTGVYSAVNVRAANGTSAGTLRDAIAAAVGHGYTVRTGQQVADAQSTAAGQFLGLIRSVLLGFAGVALFVGIFLILNTFSILVAQRTRELALFRSLGAGRGQVIGSVLIEATVVGLVAATLGLAAGFGVAALLKTVMQTQSGVRLQAGLTMPVSAVVASYLVGVAVTVIAALLPALRASRIPPVAAMREAATPDKPLTAVTIGGAVPAVAGAGLVAAALFAHLGGATLAALLGGVLLVFVGAAMLTPAVSRPAVAVLGRAFSWSTPGQLGRRNSARNPRRTAITAAALMVGMALVTGVSVLASSMTASIEQLLTKNLGADLVIAGDGWGPSMPTYDPAVIDQVRQLPGVRQAVAVYSDAAQVGTDATQVEAGDAAAMADILRLKATAGELRTLRHGETLVDEVFAADRHLAVGGTVELTTALGGPRTYTVVGIFGRSQVLPGPLLSVADAIAGFRTPQATWGYVSLQPRADARAVRAQVNALLRDNPEVSVRNQSDFVAQQANQVNSFAVMLYVLLGLALVIAVLGIVNTLALSVLERTRELGLLRAVGMRRTQIIHMVTVESVVISVFGALLGLAVGSGLGAAVVRALTEQGISVLVLPWGSMVVFLALAVVAGLLAAIAPAVRAARIDVLRAIAYE